MVLVWIQPTLTVNITQGGPGFLEIKMVTQTAGGTNKHYGQFKVNEGGKETERDSFIL